MHMGVLFDATFLQGQAKGPLQSRAAHRFVGLDRPLAIMPFGGKKPDGVAMSFPERAQMFEGAAGQGDVTVAIAFAGADVQEHSSGIDVGHLQMQPFTQTQPAGVKGDERDSLIEGGSAGKDQADLLGREDDGQFESRLSASQFHFGRPSPAQAFLPKEFDRAQGLGGGLTGDFLDSLEMDEILAQLLGADQVWSGVKMFGPLANAGQVSLLGARSNGQKLQIIGEGF